jgi:thiamine biosynthesis protein ThiI
MESTTASGSLALVRVSGEITTKARGTRRHFQQCLVRNIRDALEADGVAAAVESRWSRILVESADPKVAHRIAAVFGVSSVSPVEARVPADLDGIVRVADALYADRVRGKRFAVRARVIGDCGFRSRDIKVAVGAALDRDATVDLDAPDVRIWVEVRDGEAFLFTDKFRGLGGLPLGVEGKAVSLISGGFDSAVAAWLMLRRGVSLDYVFCNLGGEAYERAVVSVCKVLADAWSYGDRPSIHVVDFATPLADLKGAVQPKYWQVVLKRLMYRTAERVAQEIGAEAIVTGESMGQVSSQTLANLRAIEGAVTLPVLRPLVGYNKTEIIARSEQIGTAVLSRHIREYCAILPKHPVTHAKAAAVAAEERKVDLGLVEEAVAGRRVIDLRGLEPVDLVEPYLFTPLPRVALPRCPASRSRPLGGHLSRARQDPHLRTLLQLRRADRAPGRSDAA